jgi:diguanylate cyclase (GGDEF)-like protein
MELKKTLVNIEILVKDVVSGFKSRVDIKHITVKAVFPQVLPDIYVDPDRITQIFTNLIDNAIKFTPEKGKVVVEIKAGEKEIECSVSDTGIGITLEDQGKLFEKFVQIDRTPGPGTKGTGLGLVIIKDLVQLHNGKIWVESELDKGSKFIFTLPKIKTEEIFEEYITNGLKEATDRKSSLSLIVVHIVEFSQLQEKWGEKPLYLLTDIERVIKGSLRRRADTILRSTGELAIPLSDTRKEDAEVVKKRIEEAIRTYLSQCKEEWIKGVRITLGSATFPDEANNQQELLGKAREGG